MGNKDFKPDNGKYFEILDTSPRSVHVRELSSISFRFKVKKHIPHRSSIIIRFRGGRNNKNDWYFLQAEDPNFKGYAQLNSTISIKVIPLLVTGKELSIRYYISDAMGIPKNVKLSFSIKNTLAQSVIESEKRIEILIKLPSKPSFLSKDIPSVNIISTKFDHINIICPSIVEINEPFEALLRIEDKFHNLISCQLNNITLSQINTETNSKKILREITELTLSKGIKHLKDLTITKTGNYYIEVIYEGESYYSNPLICVSKKEKHSRLYWGYIHGHTTKSDGLRSVQTYFDNLIKAGLDFGTCTEHDHQWETSDEDFGYIKHIIDRYNEEDSFVSLFGYEYGTWYTGYGDICIYHNRNDIPILRSDINKYNSARKLNKNLKSYKDDVLLIGHHTALRPGHRSWNYFNQSLERLVEIYSTWGNQEYPYAEGNPIPPRYKFFGFGPYARKRGAILGKDGCYVRDALQKGYKLGFTAGGDDHIGAFPSGPIDMDNGIYPTGIMALWSEKDKLTKETLWEGLNARKCYGTTGPRVIIQFWLDDFLMGDIIKINEVPGLKSKRTIELNIVSPIKIEKVELIRNNKVFDKKDVGRSNYNVEFIDNDKFDDIYINHSKKNELFLFYYPRIFLTDFNMAWTSPIWIIE